MSLKSCQTAYGPCKFYGKDEYIGRSLYAYGEWSGDECDMLRSLANGVCLDVGANIGFMSMAMASVCNVVAFEPQPALFELLVENTRDKNVRCYNTAIGNSTQIVHMPKLRYNERGNYGSVGLVPGGFGTIQVPMTTIDSYGFENVGLIKLDVEGYELEALKGAVETIKRDRPILYVEDDRDNKRDALRSFISSLGYAIEEHKPMLFRRNNYAGNRTDIWDKQYASHNIICRARS